MSANLQTLVDNLDQGLLIVNKDGSVLFANKAASGLLPISLGKRLAVEALLVQINAAQRGYVRLPIEFNIDVAIKEAGAHQLHIRLAESPFGAGYLVLFRDGSEQAKFQTTIANLASLLEVELANPLSALASKFNLLLAEAAPDEDARCRLSAEARSLFDQGADLVSRVQQLVAFAKVFGASPIVASDRIQVMDLVSSLLLRVRPLLDNRKINFHLAGVSNELPVLYGSRDWLVEALYGYIEYLVLHCGVKSDLELQARPYGNFLSLQIRNHGRGLNKTAPTRSFIPFGQPAAKATAQPAATGLCLGLALCRHIVELHRGTMKFNDEEGDITAFVLELPSGAPPEGVIRNLDADQAKRYAEDLTRLMQRRRAG